MCPRRGVPEGDARAQGLPRGRRQLRVCQSRGSPRRRQPRPSLWLPPHQTLIPSGGTRPPPTGLAQGQGPPYCLRGHGTCGPSKSQGQAREKNQTRKASFVFRTQQPLNLGRGVGRQAPLLPRTPRGLPVTKLSCLRLWPPQQEAGIWPRSVPPASGPSRVYNDHPF